MDKVICFVIACLCTYSVAKQEKSAFSLNSVGGGGEKNVCNTKNCNNVCWNLSWMGGTCNEGNCFCWKNHGENMVSIEKKEVASLKGLGVKSGTCDPAACDSRCKSLGYAGGDCAVGSCLCYK